MPAYIVRCALLCALIASVLAACASIHVGAPPTMQQRLVAEGLVQGGSLQRIPDFALSGWNYLDPHHVQIDGGPGRRFLVTTTNNCEDLAHVNHLSYTTTGHALTRFDRLFSRTVAGWPVECHIQSIHKLLPVKVVKP